MKTIFNFLGAIVCSLFFGNVFAQAPGYMGRTNAFGASFNASTDFDGYFTTEAMSEYSSSGDSKLTFGLGLVYEKVRTKNSSIVIAINRNRLKYKLYYKDYLVVSYDNNVDDYFNPMRGTVYLNQTSIDIGFRGYGRTMIAPMGAYSQFDLRIAHIQADYSNLSITNYYEVYDYNTKEKTIVSQGYEDFSGYNSTFLSFGFGLTFGKQMILTESMLLDFSLKSNLSIASTSALRPSYYLLQERSSIEKQRFFDQYSKSVVPLNNMLWLSVALKFLK